MNTTLTTGFLLIFFVLTMFVLAGICHRKNNIFKALCCVLAAGIALRLFCISDPMLHSWDERYHALVAKNAMENPLAPKLYKEHVLPFDFKDWSTSEIWMHKQPLPFWVMAGSMLLFGVNEFAMRLPSLLLASLGILLVFWIAKMLYDEKTALLAASFFSINGLLIELSAGRVTTDHVDTFFCSWILLSVFFIVLNKINQRNGFLILAGISCGLAILSKWLPAMIVFPLYFVLNFREKAFGQICRDIFIIAVPAVLVALPWQLYAAHHFPEPYFYEQKYNALHFTKGLEGHAQPWWYYFEKIRISVNEIIYVILCWFLYKIKKQQFPRTDLFLLAWLGIPFVIFTLAKTKLPGYILFTFPAYFIIMALFVRALLDMSQNTPSKQAAFFYKTIIAVIFILASRYCFERVKPFQVQDAAKAVKAEMRSLDFPPGAVVFNVPCPVEMMFYTDCLAYQKIPDSEQLEKLKKDGHPLYVFNKKNVPQAIKNDAQIIKINMEATKAFCK